MSSFFFRFSLSHSQVSVSSVLRQYLRKYNYILLVYDTFDSFHIYTIKRKKNLLKLAIQLFVAF